MTRRPKLVNTVEEAVDERTAVSPGDRKYVSGPEAHTVDRDVLRREQQDEVAESWLGLGFLTHAQLRGAVLGSALGGLAGAVLLLPLAFLGWEGVSWGWRLGLAALCGALAGATGLAVYLGGREPELEGETQEVDGRPSIGTTLRDPRTDDRGR
jgi:hypothetical protein